MANVNGNWKGGKSLKKIPGQGVRTHDVMKGISFKDKAYKWGAGAKATGQKAAGKIARNYKRYVSPSVKILKGATGLAAGAGKLALRFPGTGLALTGAYYGGKALVKKGERVAKRSATKQWQKRDRFGRTRWYL